ncbi:hypothetical protein HN385_00175 [archaeon]|nr:hypothetical protein [archaeon]
MVLIICIIAHFLRNWLRILGLFFGGGTTVVVAKRLGKKFMGFEIESKFVNLSDQHLLSTIN